jgi:hypothetical protein
MKWIATVIGAVLIGTALRDLFHSVFRPAGQGDLSEGVMRAGWWLLERRPRPRASGLAMAGPLLVLAVLVTWTLLLLVGCALIYWPRLEDFHQASGVPAPAGFGVALYLSAMALTTLGLGDYLPIGALVRVVMPFEALIGLGLFTAALSWILDLYPVIAGKRALARQISLLARLEDRHGQRLWQMSAEMSERELSSIGDRLNAVTGQLLQMPISYYFEPRDPMHSLAAQLGTLLACVKSACEADQPTIRLRGELVRNALDDVAHALRARFLPHAPADTAAVLEAFRRQHVSEKPTGPKAEVAG